MLNLFQKKFYTHEKAESIAKMLNDIDECNWTYIVKPEPNNTGYSFIEIYDEENEFVEYWTIPA